MHTSSTPFDYYDAAMVHRDNLFDMTKNALRGRDVSILNAAHDIMRMEVCFRGHILYLQEKVAFYEAHLASFIEDPAEEPDLIGVDEG